MKQSMKKLNGTSCETGRGEALRFCRFLCVNDKAKRRVLSLILAFTLIFTLLPTMATAAETHTHGDGVTFETPIATIDDLRALYASGGSGYLTADIIQTGTVNAAISGKNVALCLNGHTLQEVSTAITDKGTYSLYDCTGTGKLSSVLETWHNGAAISVSTGGTFNLYSGTITGWRAVGVGSGVYVADTESTFNMYGGSIEYGRTTYKNRYGGGVYLNGGKMTMSGGTIKNNTLTSKAHGGGVYVKGAWIEWDGASVPDTAQFVMTGGEIKDNYAYWSGGGIMLEAGGSFLMTGGTISGNTSGDYGRGVAVYDGNYTALGRSWAYIKGGTISGNSIQTSAGGRAVIDAQNVTISTDANTYLTGACSYAYTIDYDANGGTNAPASKVGFIGIADTADAKYVLPSTSTVPKRTGYTFEDWYTASSGGTKVTEESVVGNIFAVQTLYAHWTANQYNIAFDANGGTDAPDGKENQNYDETYTIPANTPTREDCDFVGWNTKQNGTGTAYAPGEEIKNLTTIGGRTVKLYAQWKQHGIRELTSLNDDPETEDVENPIAFDVFAFVDTGASDYADITYYVSIEWSVDTSGIEFENGALYEWSTEELKYVPMEGKTIQLLGNTTSVDMEITVANRSNAAVSYALSYADHDDALTTRETKAKASADASGTLDSADQNGAATAVPGSGHAYSIDGALIDAEGNAEQSAVYSATVTVTGVADGVIIENSDDLTLGTYTVTLGAA